MTRWIETECPVQSRAEAEIADLCGREEPPTKWRRLTIDLQQVEAYFDDRSSENVEGSGVVVYMRSGDSWPVRMSYDDFDARHRQYRTKPSTA